MPDQIRTRAQLQTDFGDNTAQRISAADLRNLLASIQTSAEAQAAYAPAPPAPDTTIFWGASTSSGITDLMALTRDTAPGRGISRTITPSQASYLYLAWPASLGDGLILLDGMPTGWNSRAATYNGTAYMLYSWPWAVSSPTRIEVM